MKTYNKIILLVLFSLVLLVWGEIAKKPIFLSGNNDFVFYLFDVGQGDSILLQKGEKQVLIDGGPDNKVLGYLNRVMPAFDRNIELVVLTHPHTDHLNGLLEVIKHYNIEKIWSTDIGYESNTYQSWKRLIKEKNITLDLVVKGKEWGCEDSLSDISICLRILWPKENYGGQKVNNLNNTSIVLRVEYGKFSVLLTGDAEQETLMELVRETSEETTNIDIAAKVLKIPHHGSATSSPVKFLEKVDPEIALISVGAENKFGHPHQITAQRLQDLNISIYRTDINGNVKIVSDGEHYWTEADK